MPEDKPEPKPESKPEEPKPGEKPQEQGKEASGNWRGKGYVDYEKLSPEDATIMLKRIRKRMSRVMRDLEVVMSILKYGANAPQEGGGQNSGYRNYSYRRNYSGNYGNRQYGRYGYKRNYRQRRSDEDDVNYD